MLFSAVNSHHATHSSAAHLLWSNRCLQTKRRLDQNAAATESKLDDDFLTAENTEVRARLLRTTIAATLPACVKYV